MNQENEDRWVIVVILGLGLMAAVAAVLGPTNLGPGVEGLVIALAGLGFALLVRRALARRSRRSDAARPGRAGETKPPAVNEA